MSSRRYEVGVGCLVLAGAGLLAFMAFQIGALRGLGEHRIHVTARLPNAAGLSTGAVVAIAGVPVGEVETLEVDFDHARVGLTIDSAAQVRADAIVAMRARSLLGEKYIELRPQSKDGTLLADGGELTHVEGATEIDQLVNRLGPLLDGLDPAELTLVIQSVADAVRADPERPSRILGDAEHAMHNLAVASDDLGPTVGDARTTLASVRRTSDAARPLLSHLESSVTRLDALVASVPPEDVNALLDEVQATVKDGHAVVLRLNSATGQVEEILNKVNGFTHEDLLRMTQEEGVLVRLRPRKAKDVIAAEQKAGGK